jgi:hypothetical protein
MPFEIGPEGKKIFPNSFNPNHLRPSLENEMLSWNPEYPLKSK